MSMLIIGVNPPKSCYVCAWYNKVQCPVNDGRYYYRTERHPSCPLVEIPTPHGRLIDADKLMRDIEEYHLSDGKFQHWVDVQQTIIEAEGSET